MSAGNFTLFAKAKEALLGGKLDFLSGKFVLILVTSAYTPNELTDAFYSTVSQFEASGPGYTTGGVALTSPVIASQAVTLPETGVATSITLSPADWPNSTITAKYAVMVKQEGATIALSDSLVGYLDLNAGGSDLTSSSGDFKVQWNPAGTIVLL